MRTYAFAATDADAPLPLKPYSFERRAPRENDVVMEILYCGVCHSDLHWAKNDWGWTTYPAVMSHEIVGRVIEVGSGVTRYKVGDHVAVGCMVDSCQHCDQCRKGEEQLCREGNTGTYGGADRVTGEPTKGGYSKHLVVREEFALRVPDGLDLAKAAPLLCAGITTYSPLRTWNVGPGSRVGVIGLGGLGGLGHVAVKLASASRADRRRRSGRSEAVHPLSTRPSRSASLPSLPNSGHSTLTLDYYNYVCNIAGMNDSSAVAALSALAHADRLAAFRMLVRAGPNGMASGEIAEALSIPPTRMSFHLATLERAKLLRSWRDGRRILYAASYDDMRQLLAFLTEDCCSGNPEICGNLGDAYASTCAPETCR